MLTSRARRVTGLAVLASLALVVGAAGPAAADYTIDLPAGLACEFELRIDAVTGGPQNQNVFTDDQGNILRTLSAGRGDTLTFTNVGTEAQLTLAANGSTTKVAYHPDGSFTWTMTGHNVLILFPTDVPAGPSTTLVVGQAVFDVDAGGTYTVRTISGRTVDICAALAG